MYYRKSFTGQYQAPTFRELKNEVRSYRDKVREDHLAHTGRVAVSWPKYTIELKQYFDYLKMDCMFHFFMRWDESAFWACSMFFGHQWRILKHSGKIQYTLGHKWQNLYNVTNFGLVFSNPTPRGTPTKAAPQRHWRRVLRRRGGIGLEVLEIPGSWSPRLQTHLPTSRAHWSCVKANIQGVSE